VLNGIEGKGRSLTIANSSGGFVFKKGCKTPRTWESEMEKGEMQKGGGAKRRE